MYRNGENQVKGEIDIRYKRGRDKPSDVRNVILTVAVLLAAATYRAVFNPPGGLWQEDGPHTIGIKQVAGVSILATKFELQFILFMIGNTVGFLFFMGIIDDLTEGFTHKLELRIVILAIWFMCLYHYTFGIPNLFDSLHLLDHHGHSCSSPKSERKIVRVLTCCTLVPAFLILLVCVLCFVVN